MVDGSNFYMYKVNGMVCDVFCMCNMCSLFGIYGIGQVCYLMVGLVLSEVEVQLFYVNVLFGIIFVYNGNLMNWQ